MWHKDEIEGVQSFEHAHAVLTYLLQDYLDSHNLATFDDVCHTCRSFVLIYINAHALKVFSKRSSPSPKREVKL